MRTQLPTLGATSELTNERSHALVPTQVKSHKFFLGVDWGKVERREYEPPFLPCRRRPNSASANEVLGISNFGRDQRDAGTPVEELNANFHLLSVASSYVFPLLPASPASSRFFPLLPTPTNPYSTRYIILLGLPVPFIFSIIWRLSLTHGTHVPHLTPSVQVVLPQPLRH